MNRIMDIREDTKRGARTFWAWLRRAPAPGAGRPTPPFDAGSERINAAPGGHQRSAPSGVVLQFPLRGEALLVRLAEALRCKFAGRGPQRDPLLLTISRCPGSRLTIDGATFVEFDADRSAYHVAVEAAPDTLITLQTTDFELVVDFVAHYVAERASDPATLEAAS
ncbi:hypothetical protein HNR60_003052 [Rhodopseudomonas rhenobacensis]|uniref:Uncharacterized protein n=1 Tax=Rhodopseudomonas rhenobacensis TaxID=87461 RepID=A0A7W8DZF2_9BRAD|nr:hypothetical protein [Rhodopseudomonas rhenobacensis]MBB5048289.1 hypothetical protein [Rhodopseudomonas rhenobacensis]